MQGQGLVIVLCLALGNCVPRSPTLETGRVRRPRTRLASRPIPGPMTRSILCALFAFVFAHPAAAWVDGELSIWMDADRVPALQEAGRKFEHDYGIKVNVDATENIPNNFPLDAQCNKGPYIAIFDHHKLVECADERLIASI